MAQFRQQMETVCLNINPSPPSMHDSWHKLQTLGVFPGSGGGGQDLRVRDLNSTSKRCRTRHRRSQKLAASSRHIPLLTKCQVASIRWCPSGVCAFVSVCGLRLHVFGGGHSCVAAGNAHTTTGLYSSIPGHSGRQPGLALTLSVSVGEKEGGGFRGPRERRHEAAAR